MITALIKDYNALYRRSLEKYLQEIFADEFQSQVQFFSETNAATTHFFDITIIEMTQGEYLICQPELYLCRTGIVIGLLDEKPKINKPMPNCLSNMVFIERRASLLLIREEIINVWQNRQQMSSRGSMRSTTICAGCRHKSLAPQQVRIMEYYNKGKTVPEIAAELDISDKTIFSHKYQVMTKFSLRSDYELVRLLHRLSERGRIS